MDIAQTTCVIFIKVALVQNNVFCSYLQNDHLFMSLFIQLKPNILNIDATSA